MAETMVRMGEYVSSGSSTDVLVSIGLGSCIGLALIDRRRKVAGLAHIMLPDSSTRSDTTAAGRYADLAIPAILNDLGKLGAQRSMLEAVLVGGAKMFALGGESLDIGARNNEATRSILHGLRIPIVAAETGGTNGRTIRVYLDGIRVTSREAGTQEVVIYDRRTGSQAA